MSRMIILDGDGVINQDSDAYIKNAAEWTPVLVRTSKGEQVMQKCPEAANLSVYDDLAHFVHETLHGGA